MKKFPIKNFKYGIISSEEERSIPVGAATRSLNWLTKGSKIELRRGYALLGLTENTGAGRITGLNVAKTPNNEDILYRTRKRKIEYLNRTTGDWVEVGSDILPLAVISEDPLGEDISIEPYSNPTGKQIWFNSRNAGPHKIMTANPGSITDMYVLGTNYKGKMRIKGGRMVAWDRFGNPPNTTDGFASKLDVKNNSDYTQIAAEVAASGNGILTTFSGTLAFKGAGARRICFEVTFTDGVETFVDNGDGTLTGTAGGTGTINYTTGVYSITFAVAPANVASNITATYRWADDSAGGIADFNFSTTRVATEGFILKQATGGRFQNLMSLNGNEYCLHEQACWAVTISSDDLDINNIIFRQKVGIPNHRAACETGDGIYYIDDTDENDPHFRLLTLQNDSEAVVPRSISKQFKLNGIKIGVDLSNYRFDKGATIEFGDFILFACRTKDSEVNNRVFVYNKTNNATDLVDYWVSCFAVHDGTLVAGDSATDNVYTLFSNSDDDDSSISNYWEASAMNFDYEGLKRACELIVDGEIGPVQAAKIYMSVDHGDFVEVRSPRDVTNNASAIEGSGEYVDRSQRVNVGSLTLGRGQIGGGGDGLTAYHYRRSFRIALGKFEYIKFRIVGQNIGYLSLSELIFNDVRLKWSKVPGKYLSNR